MAIFQLKVYLEEDVYESKKPTIPLGLYRFKLQTGNSYSSSTRFRVNP